MDESPTAMANKRRLIICSFFWLTQLPLIACFDGNSMQDFCPSSSFTDYPTGLLCKQLQMVNSSDFKSSLLTKAGITNAKGKMGSAVTLASASNFPGLNGQGLSFARIDYAEGGMVPPHHHPRASEILFVSSGDLIAGFIDTNNSFYWETLSAGDMFVFPRGMVHFIRNVGNGQATTYSALNSQNPGLVSLLDAFFTSDSPVLEDAIKKSFHLSSKKIAHLRASLSASSAPLLPRSWMSFPLVACLFVVLCI
eukprot:TRINITY_DN23751_c0_g1_i1.p1 TRINITY_DN23751_c0_g1~~TRINITY_DN23751_c0_g1_i1.p1  ORF type:complete len:252 (-),score=15.29 TRINITY_DN23751_c0_g1_i1:109-864(-)